MKNIALFIEVPSNIIRAVQIKNELFPHDSIDLFVIKHEKVKWKEGIFEKLGKTKLFNSIRFIEEGDVSANGRLALFWMFANPWTGIKRYLKKRTYDDIFVFHMSQIIIPVVYTWGKRRNKKMRFHVWEEGPGALMLYGSQRKWRRRIFALCKIEDPVNEKKKFTYWTSTLMKGRRDKEENILYVGIPRIKKEDHAFRNLMNELFDFKIQDKEYDIEKYRFVILEQECQDGKEFKPESKDMDLFGKIVDEIGPGMTLMKIHPRSNPQRVNFECDLYGDKSTPFEVFLLNYDMEDKVLITVASTSIMSPKFLFDEEPVMIYLYPLVEYSELAWDYIVNYAMPFFSKSVSGIRDLYEKKERIIVCRTEKEMMESVRKLKIG